MIKLSFEKKENFSFNEEEVDNSLNDYFQILLIPNKIENKNDLNESQVIEKIIDIFVGSLKSRLGPAPDTDQRLLLFNIIKYFVTKNIPINTATVRAKVARATTRVLIGSFLARDVI